MPSNVTYLLPFLVYSILFHSLKPPHLDSRYIADLTSKDWGLYYTMTSNLGKVSEMMDSFAALNNQDKEDVRNKISLLREEIEGEREASAVENESSHRDQT